MTPGIAVIGMACRYPDAGTPEDLWKNVLAQRRSFRRIPPERLRLQDYHSPDHSRPDSTYSTNASVIADYEFDRARYRVAGSTYRAADLTHWLALDVAAQALESAWFPQGEGLPKETTGVVLGNTLTGEFSRASTMRLRWPYVRRNVEAALAERGLSPAERSELLSRIEETYKAPFEPVGEETLAGGLANTIAGRVCNYFDLKGGGFTVDGACASSLLAIISACNSLVAHDLDVALAGGVDLSIDPFELIGFAKTGALAADEMRVYDARSAGFWPGEGCGVVVLMREEDARARGHRIHAVLRGWGVSSDGSGGITRPEVPGQKLALERAYRRAGFGIETVGYFEGHGTGTTVGDATELRALSQARREASARGPRAVISSVKANFGHTKAAAGVAGLIKAVLAVREQVLPPHISADQLHPELKAADAPLRVLNEGELWPESVPLRAGVNAMGFGGINTHVVVQAEGEPVRRRHLALAERVLISSAQDKELFLLGAPSPERLETLVEALLARAGQLSRAELSDLAAHLASTLQGQRSRAAILASTPEELASRLEQLRGWLKAGAKTNQAPGVFLGAVERAPKLGFLFPGHAAPVRPDGGALRRRFDLVRELYRTAALVEGDGADTAVAQPTLVTASLAALRVLERLGIQAEVAIGHSLGELCALHWAGAFDEAALLRIAGARGQAMADLGDPRGAMASLRADAKAIESLLPPGAGATIACFNSANQTVIAGDKDAVAAVLATAKAKGIGGVALQVSRAFHSPLIAAAAPALRAALGKESIQRVRRTVFSTITGAALAPGEDLADLLCRQVTAPVRFTEALTAASQQVDLWIELGSGRTLAELAADQVPVPALHVDASGPSLAPLLEVVATAFVRGAPVDVKALFEDRFTRPFSLEKVPKFFVNPCELAPIVEGSVTVEPRAVVHAPRPEPTAVEPAKPAPAAAPAKGTSVLQVVRQLVAAKLELPPEQVNDADRLLSDLHLNSISVSQVVTDAYRHLGRPPPVSPTEYADVTLAEMAQALSEQPTTAEAPPTSEERAPAGVDHWVRSFQIVWEERPRPPASAPDKGRWRVLAPPESPLGPELEAALAKVGGGGVVVYVPEASLKWIPLLLEGAHAALAQRENSRFVVVQHSPAAAGVARSLHFEAPRVRICVVNVPPGDARTAEWVAAEAVATTSYLEVRYDAAGTRTQPMWRALPQVVDSGSLPFGPDDVLLVTGGGKGITAECALALAKRSGAKLLLMGRSNPASDPVLSQNLARIARLGVRLEYVSADVTDAAAVGAAIRAGTAALGPVTGIFHGAASNVPRALAALDEKAFAETVAPKITGLRNLLAAVGPAGLRVLVTFGSIIGRMGLRGEAHYSLANDWLTAETEQFQAEHPSCRCLALEWSVWSGAGMGERLGLLESLARDGVMAIPVEEGVAELESLLVRAKGGELPVSLVTCGRHGCPPTIDLGTPALPLLRFLERVRVHYPNVELVVDAELSTTTDPYLEDHIFRGERVFPGVMGLEAMAQVAAALTGRSEVPLFEDVFFHRPIIVSAGRSNTIRICGLVRGPDRVDLVVRSEETGFQVNHFEARCRFSSTAPHEAPSINELRLVGIEPRSEFYGPLLFHTGRFQRVTDYRLLRAKECVAEIAADGATQWFSRFLPEALVLGDPGARDASIHANQACVPHAPLLPVTIKRLWVAPPRERPAGRTLTSAVETAREGDSFTYDVDVRTPNGVLLERWEGLKLRRVANTSFNGPWPEPFLGPYLEHRLQELFPSTTVSVAFERTAGLERAERTRRVAERLLGNGTEVLHRPDGKPEVLGGAELSVSHVSNLTMGVAGAARLACDIEPVVARTAEEWKALLSPERLALAQQLLAQGGSASSAHTQVWTTQECLRKAGAGLDSPLTVVSTSEDGWNVLASGDLTIVTCVAPVKNASEPLAIAILTEGAFDARS